MTKLLEHIIVEHNPANKPVDRAVIWLHGLGASGNDFEPIVPQLGLSEDMAVRFVFPHAPQIPVTINGGMMMPAWYDILEMNLDRKVDVAQIHQSVAAVRALIDNEIRKGVLAENIVIAGFSQGGAVAYSTALTHPQKLAGLMALSTYLAVDDSGDYTEVNKSLPVKIDHGTQDPVVPVILGQRAAQTLEQAGYSVTFTTYPMAHQVCLLQIEDIGAWLNKVLA